VLDQKKIGLRLKKTVSLNRGKCHPISIEANMKNYIELEHRCAAAWSDTGRCSDEYYREMSAWIVSKHRTGSAADCRRLANEYDRMLDTFMDCSRALPRSSSLDLRMGLAATYKSLLAGDLEYFGHLVTARLG